MTVIPSHCCKDTPTGSLNAEKIAESILQCVFKIVFPVLLFVFCWKNARKQYRYHVNFSKHRPSGPMLSISRNVRPFVCLSVCLSVCSLLRYRLTVFLPPLPEVGCPIFLEIRNPWGKVMERSGLIFEHFCLEVV